MSTIETVEDLRAKLAGYEGDELVYLDDSNTLWVDGGGNHVPLGYVALEDDYR